MKSRASPITTQCLTLVAGRFQGGPLELFGASNLGGY